MEKYGIGRRCLAFLLSLTMLATVISPITVFAAVGELTPGETNLTGDIDVNDTISLPIKIYDYNADGMLFEYAETQASSSENVWLREENVSKPSASVKTDFTLGDTSYGAVQFSSATYTSGTAVNGNTDAMTWLIWAKDKTSACLSVFDRTAEGYGATSYKISAIRYMVVVYRSTGGTASDTAQFDMWDSTTNTRTSNVTVTYDNRGTTWRYMVVDLSKTGATTSDYVTAVYGYLPAGTGVAFAGYFSTEAAATAYGEAALDYTGETYHYAGDNRAFGLLRYSRTTAYGSNNTDDNISTKYASAGIVMANTFGDNPALDVSTVDLGYDYKLQGTIAENGIATLGLLQPTLSNEGLPVYKEATVTYVAELLKDALSIPEVDSSTGYRNYQYVQGVAEERYGGIDLAQWLRNHCSSMGSYSASSQKTLVGKWENVSGNINTWYDAAYFMLNSIFEGGSYNTEMNDYDYLVLSAATNSNGEKIYVFDGGFATSATPSEAESAVKYDEDTNTIQNSSGKGKTHYYYDEDNTSSTTTYYPLLPIVDANGNNTNGVTESVYFLDPGVASTTTGGNTYVNRNYNYVIASNGEFVYHADDELYFNFEGDDDVYLFIDDKLVLDIGGAHSITSITINLNDYAEIFGLEEGKTYSFDFFYMERHGVGANMRIETNIRVTDPAMITKKTAWQNNIQLDYGSIVAYKEVVEYGFSITNSGDTKLYNLTFTDSDIGVTLDSDNGLTVTGSNVYSLDGTNITSANVEKLVKELVAVVSHPDYDDITVTFENNEELKQFLKNLTADGTDQENDGLWEKSTVAIRGIGYKLTDDQVKKGVFDNTVLTTSTNSTGTKKLQGQDTMRVFVPADPMYYQWAGHELNVTKAKLVEDILKAATQTNNVLNGMVPNMSVNNVNSIAVPNQYVVVNDDLSLTINFTTTGAQVFYATVVYTYESTEYSVKIPVLVNVTAVQDSVYVLDYGLSVDLTANGELFKNDAVTVPGRDTLYGILGIGTDGEYNPNEITFTTDEDRVIYGKYGTFTYVAGTIGTIKYTLNKFLEGADIVQVAVNVYEEDITPSKITGTLDINNEVEMYKNITVLPANVLYYEDDFPAITYSTDTTNTFTSIGDSSNLTQSNDQNEQYGHDSTYEGTDAIEDEYSGNSLHTITINESNTVATFTFTGTGFELISRTNAADSATLVVTVMDSKGEKVKVIPVITQFDNENNGGSEGIYQVPVIRVKDLTLDTYTVEISGVPARDYDNLDENGEPAIVSTKLYVDGLRIYQPLGADNKNYLDTENGAKFVELRNEIASGMIAVVTYTDTEGIKVSTSTSTWTENLNGELVHNEATSVDDYILKGPNNEVYITGTYGMSALVFYVKETGEGAHSLQLALRGIDENLFFSGTTTDPAVNANVRFGVYQDGEYAWKTLKENVISSTEQYYVIDYTKCYFDETKGAYQVVVSVNNGMVSFSSLKLTGLELVSVAGEDTSLKYVGGVLYSADTASTEESASYTVAADASAYVNFYSVRQQLLSTVIVPDINTPDPFLPEIIVPDAVDPKPEAPVDLDNARPAPDRQDYNAHANKTHDQAHSDPFVYFENYIKKLRELLRRLATMAQKNFDDEVLPNA